MQTTLSDPPPAGSRFGRRALHQIGKTVQMLDEALLDEPDLDTASTFLSREEAESAFDAVLAQDRASISAWLDEGAKGCLSVEGAFAGGLVRLPGGFSVAGTRAAMVLRGNGAGGFFIVTGWPIV